MQKKKSHALIIILVILLVASAAGGGYYWWWSGRDKRALTKLGYMPDDIKTIIEHELTEEVLQTGESQLFQYALSKDQNNINDYQYYLVTADKLYGNKVDSLYDQIQALKANGYNAEQVRTLYGRMTISQLAYIANQPHTDNFDVLISALDHNYSLEESYQLCQGDPEFAMMIITGEFTLEYTKPLTDLGYDTTQTKTLLTNLSAELLEFIETMKFIPELPSLVTNEGFNIDLLPRYLIAVRERGRTVEDCIDWVNNNEDFIPSSTLNDPNSEYNWSSFYIDNPTQVPDPAALTANVNKRNYLPSDYYPSDLVDLPSTYDGTNDMDMRAPAAEAFYKLSDASVAAGYDRIVAQSNFRSYSLQQSLYSRYTSQYGSQFVADRESARPGFSEHQTGLVSDVATRNLSMLRFDEYAGYQWTLEHLHEYGFIQRYPINKEYITGYMFESWHMRYVGIEPATIMYQHGWTLDEYSLLFD